MSTKNVSLSEDAYEKLKKLKEENESFSDVVRKISESYSDITKFSGAFPEIAEVKDELGKERKEFSTRDFRGNER